MLLYDKKMVKVINKKHDTISVYTWSYKNNKYNVTKEVYINGFLSSGQTQEFNLYSLDKLENWFNLLDNKKLTIKAY